MNALFQRLFLAIALAAAPALAVAQSDDDPKEPAAETSAEAAAETDDAEGTDESAEAEDGEEAGADEAEVSDADAWAEKLRRRHHEGDVALGVCGARMTALMWFYQSSVADGREDLEPAYEAIKDSRTILKDEAERRAVDDGVGTSVSVMNEHSTELWEGLLDASEKPEGFQKAHDELFANVQECLTMFFKRPAPGSDAGADAEEAEADTAAETEDDSAGEATD